MGSNQRNSYTEQQDVGSKSFVKTGVAFDIQDLVFRYITLMEGIHHSKGATHYSGQCVWELVRSGMVLVRERHDKLTS